MSAPNQETTLVPGEMLDGKYRVTRVLGRGGMGVVVEALRVGLGERVAIKVLHQRYVDNPEAIARFHHEARALASIRGDHSVRVLDVGATPAGAPFIVMELLLGGDLAAVVKTGGLSSEEAALYVLQACEGMAEVHANGIVHRDLKPGNLFLTRRVDGRPLVKVLDFGIAKSALPMDETDRAVTLTLIALGTPLYMAPEQIRCAKDVDARADVWSLGAILYELLAGRAAFGGSSAAHVTSQVLEAQPAPLGPFGVPAGLEAVVLRALAKKPMHRFNDVAELARALAPFAGPSGPEHAERAARILRREGHGAGAAHFTEAPSGDAQTTLFQSEVRSRKSDAKGPATRLAFVAVASLSALVVVLAFVLVDAMRAASSEQIHAARRGIATATVARAAAARTAFSLTSGVEVTDIDDLPDAPTSAPTKAPPAAAKTPSTAAKSAPKAASPTPPAPPAPRPTARAAPRANAPTESSDDLLSSRK